MDSMNCTQFASLIDRYLDNELDMVARQGMEAHAQACTECAQRLDMATKLSTMCAELDEGLHIPLDAQAAWRRAVRDEAAKKKKRGAVSWVKTAGAVAAAVVVLMGGTFMMRNGNFQLSPDEPIQITTSGRNGAVTADYSKYVEDELQEQPMSGAGNQWENPSFDIDGQGSLAPQANAKVAATNDVGQPASDPDAARPERKLIKSANRDIETSKFESDLQIVREMIVSDYQGYEESFSQWGEPLEGKSGGRTAYIAARIPSDDLDKFLDAMDEAVTVTGQSENTTDISAAYRDTATALANKKELRTRTQALIAQAQSVEELIQIEDRLTTLQTEIDQVENTIRGWDNQVSLSAVSITVTEVPDKSAVQPINATTWGERIKQSFSQSINLFTGFVQDMAVFVALVWPWIVLLILVIIVIRAITKRRRK